jgi:hypothetical protein
MKKTIILVLTILSVLSATNAVAQSSKFSLKKFLNVAAINLKPTPWIVGLGGNVIDDDGKPFQSLFDTKKSWNIQAYPTRATIEKTMLYGWSTEFAFNYNRIKTGKNINGDIRTQTGNYLSFDLSGKFNFNEFFKEKTWFDIYLIHGYGYTYRDAVNYKNVITANVGFGADAWVYDDMLGINIQTQAKFGLNSPFIKTGANYLQHSLSIIYRFNTVGKKSGGGARYKFFKKRKPLSQ